MGRRLAVLLAPVVVSCAALLATPGQVLAAGQITETGATTYEVLPAQSQIKVTLTLKMVNQRSGYYADQTEIVVDAQAGPLSISSNGGKVSQKVVNTTTYYRYVQLDYPAVYYGQTRTVSVSYTIPAGLGADGGYRALSAYVSLCANGNGYDGGSLTLLVPTGFDMTLDYGMALKRGQDKNNEEVWSSGMVADRDTLWTCVDGQRADLLKTESLTAGQQQFTLEGWPEDPGWLATMKADVAKDVPALEQLTGLTMSGSRVTIVEAGDFQLGDYGGSYNSYTHISYIPEEIDPATVAHELSHIWFNTQMLDDKWMSEGLAGYSEQVAGAGNYLPCNEPGPYPGSGHADLAHWTVLNDNSSLIDIEIVDYNYSASCYVFSTLAEDMGGDNFRNVVVAASDGTAAYELKPSDSFTTGGVPVTSEQMLDLIDEVGMVPGGVDDLDTASDLFVRYGILDESTLAGRSAARAKYHDLVTRAGSWTMPLAVREPMSAWNFASAVDAMATVDQILTTRDAIQSKVGGLSLDDTSVRQDFEAAKTKADLTSVLDTLEKEAAAADVVAQAVKAHDGSRSVLESIGLIGTDVDTKLQAAQNDLVALKPELATSEAQEVLDALDRASDEGLVRAGAGTGILVVLLLLAVVIALMLRRQREPAAAPTLGYGAAAWPGQGPGYAQPWSAGQMPMQGPQPGQWPTNQPSPWQSPPAAQPGQWPTGQTGQPPAAQPSPWQSPPAAQPGQWPTGQTGPWQSPPVPATQPSPWRPPAATPAPSEPPAAAPEPWRPEPASSASLPDTPAPEPWQPETASPTAPGAEPASDRTRPTEPPVARPEPLSWWARSEPVSSEPAGPSDAAETPAENAPPNASEEELPRWEP
jgi:hypothetical protein